MPDAVKYTVKALVVLPDRVIVNWPVVGPASVAAASLALIVTAGKEDTSSLVIVTVALPGDPIVYAAFALNVTTTVSSLSTAVSLTGVTVVAADADPTGIVTLVPMLL